MPQITQGNRLYLYQLLSRELGVGKQTKIELAEEVLVADDILPSDLDCASTQELMEALGDIVRVTIFRRGRIYVTVLTNPEYDGYLQAPAEEHAPQQRKAQGRKSWKQKRAPKIPKPAKPKPKNRSQATDIPTGGDAEISVGAGLAGVDATGAPEAGAHDADHTEMEVQAQPNMPQPAEPAATQATPMPELTVVPVADDATPVAPATPELVEAGPDSAPGTRAESAPDAPTATSDKAASDTPDESSPEPEEEAAETTETSSDTHAEAASAETIAVVEPQVSPTDDQTVQPISKEGPSSEANDAKAAEASSAPATTSEDTGTGAQAEESHDASSPAQEMPSPATEAPAHDEQDAAATGATPADEEPLFFAGEHTSIRLVSMPAEEPERAPARARIFPDSFAHEVRMENEALANLYSILPFDVDPVALLDEDWRFAESIESFTYEDAYLRFPLRYLRSNDEPVEVTLRRVAPGASGKRWLLVDVAIGDEVGLWGLPVADEGAWSHLSDAWRHPHTLVSPRRELARFAHLGNLETLLERLADAAQDEWWGHDHEILSDYLALTFWRAKRQGKIAVSLDGRHAALDTGLVSADGYPVFMHFEERGGKVPWTFDHFGTDDQGLAPEPPTYVSELSHITLVAGAGVRLSREVARTHGDAITAQVEQAVRYAARNHRVATPAFDPQTDELRLLVPIRDDEGEVSALVLAPDTLTGYIALSVMSREAAYACARAVSAEQPSWLLPQ